MNDINESEKNKYLSIYFSKNSLYNYKFIFNRIEGKFNKFNIFDEIYEIYWLINELLKIDNTIINFLFFSEQNNIILEKFNNLLSITLVEKIFQPCLRLINNIIVLCNDKILKQNLINLFFKKEIIITILNNILINNKEFNDESILKDILLLIFNLSCFEPKETKEIFFNNIIDLILNKKFNNDFENLKILIYIYYRIYVFDNHEFNINDKSVINIFYLYFQFNQTDLGINLILIDILYGCLISMKKKINYDIKNITSVIDFSQNVNLDIIQQYIITQYNEINK
jgi:hypothetical protein